MSTEERGLEALTAIEVEISTRDLTETVASLCASYQKIKDPLESALALIEKFPFIGTKVVNTIRFLMKLADSVCD